MRFLVLLAALMISASPSFAQNKTAVPDVPEALAALSERGAQLRYLGKEHGMDGWIAMYQGQEQYYYITADGKAFVTGLMFGADGRPVTIEQVRALQQQGGEFLDLLADDTAPKTESLADVKAETSIVDSGKKNSPAERMFADVERANTIRLGSASAPVIYSFIDPQCPHCHEFIKQVRGTYLEKGIVQIKLIPVGFIKGSPEQAALLLASPDAEARFYRHLDGDKDAIPTKEGVSTQAVQKNMAVMQAWKFDVTPLTVYRSRSGEIKIIRGVPKDLPGMIADLPATPPTGAQSTP